jgi:hypothetical protein
MQKEKVVKQLLTWLLILILAAPSASMGQGSGGAPQSTFSEEQLAQMVAPIALYPDELLSQILMASTYPLEIVQASRWAKQNKNLTGDALAKALEAQSWDPSVKSLINFPQVLDMMNEKLDWTQTLGDAFLAQQKDVMDTVQKLRVKAETAGNLKTTPEQKVIVEKETKYIIIQPASPQVVYVPAYNPTVVYGPWWYPAYPPYYYYPPGYVVGAAAFSFAAGVAVGAAWGYAWGGCNWHGGNVKINYNQNININNNINRNHYANQWGGGGKGGSGSWQHNPQHRQGVAYRDQGTSQRYGQSQARTMENKQAARGYGDRGNVSSQPRTQPQDLKSQAGTQEKKTGTQAGTQQKNLGSQGEASQKNLGSKQGIQQSDRSAFGGSGSGKTERMASQRGQSERMSSQQGGKSRGSSGGSSGGGGGKGGGGSRGGGGGRGR